MALVWLRVYPTYEVLAFFFSLHKANAQRGVVDVLATLEAHTVFVCERPAKERQKLRSVQAVMDAFPDVRLVIDAKEQRVQRPGGNDENGTSRQKPFYSGKKKAHTLKTQVAVSPDGTFQSVGKSSPGSVHDLTLLRQSDLMHRIEKTEAAMMDKGYDGIQTIDPKDPHKNGPLRSCYLPHKARRGHPLTDEQKFFNAHLSKYRIVVEHSLAQMNQFQVLAQVSGVGSSLPTRQAEAQRLDPDCGRLGEPAHLAKTPEDISDDLSQSRRTNRNGYDIATQQL